MGLSRTCRGRHGAVGIVEFGLKACWDEAVKELTYKYSCMVCVTVELHARKTTEVARLLDDSEEERQLEEKRAEIQAYRLIRTEMTDRRERDRKLRNSLKALQFKLYEQMQVCISHISSSGV